MDGWIGFSFLLCNGVISKGFGLVYVIDFMCFGTSYVLPQIAKPNISINPMILKLSSTAHGEMEVLKINFGSIYHASQPRV